VSQAWREGVDAERDEFRSSLIGLGFTDDGETLRGPVEWSHNGHGYRAIIQVELDGRFPFGPPQVQIINAGTELEQTFHVERNGNLCLWTRNVPVESAPWREPGRLIEKVSGWLTQTALGWPDDDDRDLERYLELDDTRMLVYNAGELGTDNAFFRTRGSLESPSAYVIDPLPWRHPNTHKMGKRGPRRREQHLVWYTNLGVINKPIREWEDLADMVGADVVAIQQLIAAGSVEFILLSYRRESGEPGMLALTFVFNRNGSIGIKACESADASPDTIKLRAGNDAAELASKRIAIVGCGAVGSHIANLLFRAGVRHFTLIDPERLRPGNVIRHLADHRFVGLPKPLAVIGVLRSLGLDVSSIKPLSYYLDTPERAAELVSHHDLVIDATADERATFLLKWASETLDRPMVSVCVQREGGLVRADRFPLFPAGEFSGEESHVSSTPIIENGEVAKYERGCGNPVSMTPPLAAVAAATLGTRMAIDELSRTQSMPATIVEVLSPQPDSPYDHLGIITSEIPERVAANV
jgi:molybdopterin/thiamine biosynthesis adenylyltransferase